MQNRRAGKFILTGLFALAIVGNAKAEQLEFASRSYAGMPQLLRGEAGAEITIKGILHVPAGSGPHPALVVAHSCAGWTASGHGEEKIIEAAEKAGFATLVYDSFDPRNWQNVCAGSAGPAGTPSVVADAFAALQALGKDERIQKDAIFVAGASMGGMTAWYTSLEPLRRKVVQGDARFAGHISFYPSGDHGVIADKVFAGGPVLVMFGLQDDWTPPKRVRLMMERQKAYSKQPLPEIRYVDYEGARHGWLNVGIFSAKYLPSASSRLNCPLIYYGGAESNHMIWVDGREMDVPFAESGKHLNGCATPGVTIEGSSSVTTKSLAEMTAFMKQVLGP
jgi:dienelactone hydrolase